MNTRTVEKWTWILIYGGLLALCLGVFVARGDEALGNGFMLGGAGAAAVGVVLIYVRSRMKPSEK
ncbi:hypothetical protein OOT46_22720 [Aquabacterium sp. A7-Y]|uniref:hypothetical protein n=1 Tax=Aquabacterium sp. A7-Y TaxID=1349605 RepID=UPI00223DB493|nr:hypothetical protein [Aquabacterium sp. A7-Y]MCW7540639.1 hypothetical protein [Aquabacterium sp. A7-Y]